MAAPAIITIAITGAIPRKADMPAVPITPSEQSLGLSVAAMVQ